MCKLYRSQAETKGSVREQRLREAKVVVADVGQQEMSSDLLHSWG